MCDLSIGPLHRATYALAFAIDILQLKKWPQQCAFDYNAALKLFLESHVHRVLFV